MRCRRSIREVTSYRVAPLLGLFSLLGLFGTLSPAGPQSLGAQSLLDSYTPVTEAMLLSPPEGEWLMWRGTYGHWGHSPLDQINTSNVGTLRLAWPWP